MRGIFIISESYLATFLAEFLHSMNFDVDPLGLPQVPEDSMGLGVTPNAYFFPSKYTKQLFLVEFCDTPVGIEVRFDFGWTEDGGGQWHLWIKIPNEATAHLKVVTPNLILEKIFFVLLISARDHPHKRIQFNFRILTVCKEWNN